MANKNFTTLKIGGAERTLVFSISTLEMFMNESKKLALAGEDVENDFTRMKILFYCALKIGDRSTKTLPENFTTELTLEWIEQCDQEDFNEANDMAIDAMGFIESAEQRTFDRRMKQLTAMGKNPSDIVDQAILANS